MSTTQKINGTISGGNDAGGSQAGHVFPFRCFLIMPGKVRRLSLLLGFEVVSPLSETRGAAQSLT